MKREDHMSHCCGVCKQAKSAFYMNNKRICLRCDELLLDIEIECEEEPVATPKRTVTLQIAGKKTTFRTNA